MNFEDVLLNEQKNIDFDKIYTKPEIAKMCISKCNIKSYDRIIEPSAGNGAFSSQIPNCEAYDLMPEHKSIKKQDFLIAYRFPQFKGKPHEVRKKLTSKAASTIEVEILDIEVEFKKIGSHENFYEELKKEVK